ncbi:MAG: DMT family transporter [Aliishimia sp.]
MNQQTSQNSTRAITLMLTAIIFLSMMDACVKAVAPSVGAIPALWARYAGQMLVVLVLVAPRIKTVIKTNHLPLQLARSVLLLLATAFFFQGLSRIGLAQATAVMVLNPLFITLGAALFLSETIGLRRIIAIVVAFCGAMLIIQPGTDTFNPDALFPLAAAICFAGYALVTRAVGRAEDPWTSLFYTALVGGIVMSLLLPTAWVPLNFKSSGLLVAIALFGTTGQLLLIKAFSSAPAGVLAPFGYAGVVCATFIGFVFFSEIPVLTTWLGALVIVGAGLYVWARETQSNTN